MTEVSVETPEIMEVVTYLKDAQKATVTYVDGTTRKKLEVVDLLGKSGEVIEYSTIERIKITIATVVIPSLLMASQTV